MELHADLDRSLAGSAAELPHAKRGARPVSSQATRAWGGAGPRARSARAAKSRWRLATSASNSSIVACGQPRTGADRRVEVERRSVFERLQSVEEPAIQEGRTVDCHGEVILVRYPAPAVFL